MLKVEVDFLKELAEDEDIRRAILKIKSFNQDSDELIIENKFGDYEKHSELIEEIHSKSTETEKKLCEKILRLFAERCIDYLTTVVKEEYV